MLTWPAKIETLQISVFQVDSCACSRRQNQYVGEEVGLEVVNENASDVIITSNARGFFASYNIGEDKGSDHFTLIFNPGIAAKGHMLQLDSLWLVPGFAQTRR